MGSVVRVLSSDPKSASRCVSVAKSLNYAVFHFFTCKMRMVIKRLSGGWEASYKKVRV